MLQKQPKYYTPKEYLALEEATETKNEYFQGEIFAMSGSSINHNQIAVNVCTILNVAFEEKLCKVFSSDVKLLVQANGLYTYPDAMVVCGPVEYAEGRNDTVINPIVIVEILSESTYGYDQGEKFERYRDLPSFRDYILIDQDRVYIEHYHKLDDGHWVLTLFNNLDTSLILTAIEVSLSVRRIYHKVEWPTKKLTLKEAHAPYSASLIEMLSDNEVVILEKAGEPVAALLPIAAYKTYQSWYEAEESYQVEEVTEEV